jgi:peptidoglycan/LPS O-acetylase OafA/YrhL
MVGQIRSEIAGLRAVAVINVVLFHLKLSVFRGGFVGVDVFFVISGYLITRNILIDLDTGRFSLGQFYIRRMRRIFPALIFTAVLTYLAGAIWCSPLMFLDLAKETTHAVLSISNIQYWRGSHQYFAPNSDELALLHCWSLSLEEQFYLVWPVFIALAQKIGRTFEAIAVAALASLLASVIVSRFDPSAAFFLTPFRIYEFGCGALVLLCETKINFSRAAAEVLSAAGLLCIFAGVLLFRSDMPFLDVAMLLPCLGAGMTILAGNGTRISRLFTNSSMIGIGAISYSLYLCHWPIIFFGRFIFGDSADSVAGMLAMTSAMLVLAIVMYSLVERRFIEPEVQSASFVKNVAGFWSIILALAAITHTTFLTKGFAWRLPEAKNESAHLEDFPSGADMEPMKGPIRFELVGDSHVVQYLAGLSPLARELNTRFDIRASPGCPMLYGVTLKDRGRSEACQSWRDRTLRHLESASLPIIFAQGWELYTEETADFEFEPTETAAGTEKSLATLQLAIEKTIERIGARSRIQTKWPDRIDLLRPVEYFCDSECPVVKDGIWLYFEQTHFSVAGSKYMVTRSADVFRGFLEH